MTCRSKPRRVRLATVPNVIGLADIVISVTILLKTSMLRRGKNGHEMSVWLPSVGQRKCHRELAEVLDGGGHQELVLCSIWSSKAKAGEPEDAF